MNNKTSAKPNQLVDEKIVYMKNRTDNIVESNDKENITEEGYILPNHYMPKGHYQTIDIIQDQLSDKGFVAFCKFLVIKYLVRVQDADKKSKERSYTKASYYLNELINRASKNSKPVDEERIKPKYYKKHNLEVVDVVEDQFDEEELCGAYTGIIIKYLLRADKKHGLEDYKKANYFLNRLLNYTKNK